MMKMKVTDKISRGVFNTFIVLFFSALWTSPFWASSCSSGGEEEPSNLVIECNCAGYIKKTQVEYEYEQLIRPIYVEAVGFNGMVLVDSIGSVFVLSDDELLHEIIQYSYNVGDTIK